MGNNDDCETALILASQNDFLETVKYLVGAELNAKNKNGKTALVLASENERVEIEKYLLAKI